MGHRENARDALLPYFNARPNNEMRAEVRGAYYQVSVVRYISDGAEDLFFTHEGSINIKFHNCSETLWLLGEYLHKYDDSILLKTSTYDDPLYKRVCELIVKLLTSNNEKYCDGVINSPNTSIWEDRPKDKRPFFFSSPLD